MLSSFPFYGTFATQFLRQRACSVGHVINTRAMTPAGLLQVVVRPWSVRRDLQRVAFGFWIQLMMGTTHIDGNILIFCLDYQFVLLFCYHEIVFKIFPTQLPKLSSLLPFSSEGVVSLFEHTAATATATTKTTTMSVVY